MRLGAFAGILLAAIACHDAIDMGVRALSDKRTRDVVLYGPSFHVELEPEPTPNLKEGEKSGFQVRAILESGEVCRFCEGSWASSAPEVAAFSEPYPRCAGERCAVLEAVSPGTAVLTVEVCQNYDRDCVRTKFSVRVVP